MGLGTHLVKEQRTNECKNSILQIETAEVGLMLCHQHPLDMLTGTPWQDHYVEGDHSTRSGQNVLCAIFIDSSSQQSFRV